MEIKKMLQYIFIICAVIKMFYKALLKAGLHYGDYRSKLVHFEEQKSIFCIFIQPQLRAIITTVYTALSMLTLLKHAYSCMTTMPDSGNTKGGSITILLASCLTGLDQPVLQIKTKIVRSHTPDFKQVKQEPPLNVTSMQKCQPVFARALLEPVL